MDKPSSSGKDRFKLAKPGARSNRSNEIPPTPKSPSAPRDSGTIHGATKSTRTNLRTWFMGAVTGAAATVALIAGYNNLFSKKPQEVQGIGMVRKSTTTTETAGEESQNVAQLQLSQDNNPTELKSFLDSILRTSMKKLVIIDMGADDCGPCRKTKPYFGKAADHFAEKGDPVRFYNINFKKMDNLEGGLEREFRAFFGKIGLDPEKVSQGFPQFTKVKNGKVVGFVQGPWEFFGKDALDEQVFIQIIQSCLEGNDCGRIQ